MTTGTNQREIEPFKWFKNLFKKPKIIFIGDFGIYHYVWCCDTYHEDSHGLKYDVYAKLKAVEVYDNLIEVEVMDIKINDSASTDIQNIIKNNFPKYVNPKYVRWQVKQKTVTEEKK
jgi:hypothetical protein